MLRLFHKLIDYLRYGKHYPPTSSWERDRFPEYLDISQYTYQPGPPVPFSTGIHSIMYLNQHPHLKRPPVQ